MQQQLKHTTPKHLSTIDFLLNQLLLPAISPFQEKKMKNLMKWIGGKIQKCRLNSNNYSLLSFTTVGKRKIGFQKYISQNAIVKTKCPTRKKSWQPKTRQNKV